MNKLAFLIYHCTCNPTLENMNDNNDRLKLLLAKLEQVALKQEVFNAEIDILKKEILSLTSTIVDPAARVERANQPLEKAVEKKPTPFKTFEPKPKSMFSKAPAQSFPRKPVFNLSLEKFIGENLINKIGIAILVIGVAIGAKYSIEHDLISPLTRIVLGYLTAIALLLVGIKLKKNYTAYSAVLVGGAMAIMYFITFAAYDFYGLLPQFAAFGLMVVFTVFTVIASLSYNQQALAIIGLVGAYAVPFLLSDGSGKVMILFSYMAIINAGILALSFKKYWKVLFFTAFGLTWLIFGGWYMQQFNNFVHYNLAFSFLIIFFLEFYITFLSYKLVKKEIQKDFIN